MAITRQRVGARTWHAAGLLGVVSAEEVASPVEVAATVTASAEKGFATVLKVLEANATDAAPTATSSALGSHSDLLWGLNTTQKTLLLASSTLLLIVLIVLILFFVRRSSSPTPLLPPPKKDSFDERATPLPSKRSSTIDMRRRSYRPSSGFSAEERKPPPETSWGS